MLKHFSYSSVLSQKILTIAVENNLSTKMHFLKESKQNNNLEVKIVLLFYLLHKRPIVFTFRGIHVPLGNYWMVTKYFERCKNQLRTWTSLVAQTVKNLPAIQTRVQSLGQEDPLEKAMATHSSILAYRIPRQRALVSYIVHGVTKSWTWLSD